MIYLFQSTRKVLHLRNNIVKSNTYDSAFLLLSHLQNDTDVTSRCMQFIFVTEKEGFQHQKIDFNPFAGRNTQLHTLIRQVINDRPLGMAFAILRATLLDCLVCQILIGFKQAFHFNFECFKRVVQPVQRYLVIQVLESLFSFRRE